MKINKSHIEPNERLEDSPLLSLRLKNVLYRAGIETFEQLSKYSELHLLRLPGFGQSAMEEIIILESFTDFRLKSNFE